MLTYDLIEAFEICHLGSDVRSSRNGHNYVLSLPVKKLLLYLFHIQSALLVVMGKNFD